MDWIKRVSTLRQWTSNGLRAPHKPLLMLYALGRFQQCQDQALRYSDIEQDMRELLQEYGPAHRTSPAYPFHHLTGDGVWVVRTDRGDGSPGTGVRALRESGAAGRLAPELRAALAEDPMLLGRLAHTLLEVHFPPSLHADITADVGLDLDSVDGAIRSHGTAGERRRTAELRRLVLVAYECRCAFCGFDGSIGRMPVGLDAAHVRWRAFQGADELANALCLCSLHHKLFDRGVLGLDVDRRITVSQEFVGRSTAARAHVLGLVGRTLRGPQHGSAPVDLDNVAWHTAQVFRGEARTARHAS